MAAEEAEAHLLLAEAEVAHLPLSAVEEVQTHLAAEVRPVHLAAEEAVLPVQEGYLRQAGHHSSHYPQHVLWSTS